MTKLAMVFLLFATSAAVEFDTSRIPVGGTEAKFAGSRRVLVEKSAEATIVRVEEGERVDTITLHVQDGKVERVTRTDNGKMRPFVAMDRPRVVVDGIDLEPYLTGAAGERPSAIQPPPRHRMPRSPMAQREYVCPKDGTMLRVPTEAPEKAYTCPVDGTPMAAGVGPNRKYYRVE